MYKSPRKNKLEKLGNTDRREILKNIRDSKQLCCREKMCDIVKRKLPICSEVTKEVQERNHVVEKEVKFGKVEDYQQKEI